MSFTNFFFSKVYQLDSQHYIRHDKYHGRRLNETEFHCELRQFLHNGRALRTDVLNGTLHKLELLYAQVSKLESFRFYSTSLLVIYDGSTTTKDVQLDEEIKVFCDRVDVKIVDFAHVTYNGFCDDQIKYEGPDEGFMYGLSNAIKIFKEILSTDSQPVS